MATAVVAGLRTFANLEARLAYIQDLAEQAASTYQTPTSADPLIGTSGSDDWLVGTAYGDDFLVGTATV